MQAVTTDIDRQGDTGRKCACFISVADPDCELGFFGPLDPDFSNCLIRIRIVKFIITIRNTVNEAAF